MKILTTSASAVVLLSTLTTAQLQDDRLVGTWTTKSRKVMTGPSFYNPVADRFTEPSLPGISYSFTIDGHWESAYYRAVSNAANPNCPSGILQWQHGTYRIAANGSLYLQPIGVDGRQQLSTPCQYANSVYERYYQPEFLQSYTVETDPFHNIPRLNLFQFDGAPQQPLYLAYSPPEMLPTQTLNPTATARATGKTKKIKRNEDPQVLLAMGEPLNRNAIVHSDARHWTDFEPDRLWYVGLGLVVVGSAMYMYPSARKNPTTK